MNSYSTAVGVHARRFFGYTLSDADEDYSIQKFRSRFFWVCSFENRSLTASA